MNETKLTELDPAKTYVDYLGRKWFYNGYWKTPSVPERWGLDTDLLRLFPDLREHVPAWYEPLLEKGWVWNPRIEKLVRIGADGITLVIERDLGMYWMWNHPCPHDEAILVAKEDALEDCLAVAEPLVWKGVAS